MYHFCYIILSIFFSLQMMSGDNGLVPLSQLLRVLKISGLQKNDPRLVESMKLIKKFIEGQPEFYARGELFLTKEMFQKCIHNNAVLIQRAFCGDFVIPMFSNFCSVIDDIYYSCRTHSEGKVCIIGEHTTTIVIPFIHMSITY